ncbi:MAG: nucleotide exchange factor GrpE [Bdellovibrionales bacterium]
MSDQDQNSSQNSTAPSPGGAEKDSVGAEIQKLQAEAEKFKNDYLYLRAEFENYKRHSVKERSDLMKYAGERMARDLVGVLDNFERALAVEVKPETVETYVKGVQMTAQELKALLEKHGIKEVPSEKQPFDPNVHEALGSEPTTQIPDGHVLRVFEKPYKFHDKLLRPGRVIIAKTPEA